MSHRLDPLLQPDSIALIGASNDAGRIGGMPLDILRHFEFPGAVYPVNPKYEEVFGYKCYPDIESLPAVPDLAVLAVAAPGVTAMLERCHALGVRAAIIYAAGFAEAGDAGQALQTELEEFAAKSGMVIAGPNCVGFANLNKHAYTAFASVFKSAPVQKEPGRVSIIGQSGNVCATLFSGSRDLGVPVSHFLNTGNEACLDMSDYLEFLAQDEATDTVLAYIEQLRDGPGFIDAALEMSRCNKPLIVFQAGETEKGSEAIRSHTAALAGDMAISQAAFAQLNVIQARDIPQLADLAYLTGYRHRTGGRRMAVMSISGALGGVLADKMVGAGLDVPDFPQDVQDVLRSGIPDYGMVSNPVDVTGNIANKAGFFPDALASVANCDQVDVVVLYIPGYLLDRMADTIIEASNQSDKLFVVIDTAQATCRDDLRAASIAVFDDTRRAVEALGPFCNWLEGRERAAKWAAQRNAKPLYDKAELTSIPNEFDSKQLLASYGLPEMPERVAKNEDEAVAAAVELGFPVAIKILSADILHKTEIGGLRLSLNDEAAVRSGVRDVLASASANAPDAKIDGVLVQRMSSGVSELIVGVTTDSVFGQALTVGLGGVLTEIYKDVTHRLLPVDSALAGEMLSELIAYPLLEGYRGRPKADVAAATAAIAAVSNAAMALSPGIQEIEVNPLLVREDGAGVVAIDAVMTK